jgi:hypothetical protein
MSYLDDRVLDGHTKDDNTSLSPKVIDPTHVINMPEIEIKGVVCSCDPSSEEDYDPMTFDFLTSISPLIFPIAVSKDVPAAAVAGAIADEFNSQRFPRVIVDRLQDVLIDIIPEFSIDIHRFFDIKFKLSNTLENDIGPANIKVRTALQLVQRGELTVPGSPISDVQVNKIVDFLLTERGTIEAAAAVIAKGKKLFGQYIADYSDGLAEAVLVEYYKQGDSLYNRFYDKLLRNHKHKPCPGYDGCQFWHNRDRILRALDAGS